MQTTGYGIASISILGTEGLEVMVKSLEKRGGTVAAGAAAGYYLSDTLRFFKYPGAKTIPRLQTDLVF